MRRYLILSAALLLTARVFAWLPVFVGHRGCAFGVENTAEAYRYGADHFGYAGLECDVKVTADGHYIISHDDNTERVGGRLDVNTSTLAELQAEQYIQKRRGLTYAGRICTLDEFLQICVEKHVFPIVELKWANGINNNDMSRFAGVVALLEQYGLTDKAVILTSMRQSLEYILENYPTLHCQYLMMEMTDEKIDWCIRNGVEPSCAHTGITACQVMRCHDAGLKVAGWTVDQQADYERISKIGVEYITTNSLSKYQPDIAPVDWNASCR
ncbi:MAG: hypothetical protein KBS77_02175 [Bacteroidales bacterium]|nr:hypothetical protein [Candidatus Colicola faecequi]